MQCDSGDGGGGGAAAAAADDDDDDDDDRRREDDNDVDIDDEISEVICLPPTYCTMMVIGQVISLS